MTAKTYTHEFKCGYKAVMSSEEHGELIVLTIEWSPRVPKPGDMSEQECDEFLLEYHRWRDESVVDLMRGDS